MIKTVSTMVLALMFSVSAQAASWTVDASHTRAGFRVSHMMVSSVEGSFTDVKGELDYELGNPKGSR